MGFEDLYHFMTTRVIQFCVTSAGKLTLQRLERELTTNDTYDLKQSQESIKR